MISENLFNIHKYYKYYILYIIIIIIIINYSLCNPNTVFFAAARAHVRHDRTK